MSEMRCDDCRSLLDAYVDQELAPRDAARVRDHLDLCGACAAEHRMLSEVSARVRRAIDRPVAPDVLKARIRGELARVDTPRPAAMRWNWRKLGAAALFLAIASGGGGAYLARKARGRALDTSAQVLSSHVRSLMPGHLTDVASNDQHNVKPWFNGRANFSPVVPRLDSAGFPLVGGRLDYVGERVAAAVVYARRQHIINVFSWPEAGARREEPSISSERGYHLVRWTDDGVEYWAASDVSVPDLQTFVGLFRREAAR